LFLLSYTTSFSLWGWLAEGKPSSFLFLEERARVFVSVVFMFCFSVLFFVFLVLAMY